MNKAPEPRVKEAPPAMAPRRTATEPPAGEAPLPVVKEVSLRDVVSSKAAPVEHADAAILGSLEARVLDLARRLGSVEAIVQRLDRLNKGTEGSGSGTGTPPPEVQAMIRSVQDLGKEVKDIRNGLRGTLGYDAYHTFKCRKCGSQGLVATVLRCTKCGDQGWRGWSPK